MLCIYSKIFIKNMFLHNKSFTVTLATYCTFSKNSFHTTEMTSLQLKLNKNISTTPYTNKSKLQQANVQVTFFPDKSISGDE